MNASLKLDIRSKIIIYILKEFILQKEVYGVFTFTVYPNCSIYMMKFPQIQKQQTRSLRRQTPEALVLIHLFQQKKCALVPEVVMVTKVCRMGAESAALPCDFKT